MSLESIRRTLVKDLPGSSKRKSSHWQFHTGSMRLTEDLKVFGIDGFSNRTRRFPGSQILHLRNLKKTFPWAKESLESPDFNNAVEICHKQSREIDTCLARNFFTLDLIEGLPQVSTDRVCVIGDGQANFVSLALSRKSFKKIVSINLSEVLLSDLDLIENLEAVDSDEISVARTEIEIRQFFKDPSKRLLLVSAQYASFLAGMKIDLFVNIASFQEMTPELIDEYFTVIRLNNSYLYACNRVEKVLYGGEVNRFFDYPWQNSDVLLDELCEWHQYSYTLKSFKLYKKFSYDGAMWHRLVKFE
jgi:hypothetical protein